MAGFKMVMGKNSKNSKNSTTGKPEKKSTGRSEKGVTLIAANTEVCGDILFVNQLYVNGHVKGNINAAPDGDATVVVSDEGSVSGEIHVPNVVINGKVEGNVFATNRMELATRAEVKGNVYYKLIEMQLGAMVDGQLVHDETLGSEKPNVHPFPAETAENESASGTD